MNSLPAALPPARMDPDRLGQALLNICLNALDAMPDGGTLTLASTGPGGTTFRILLPCTPEAAQPD